MNSKENRSRVQKFNELIGSLLLGYVGAWLLMKTHLTPETLELHRPNFLKILEGTGPAPDQYRVLQNHLIGLLYRRLDFYWSVKAFTALSLAATIFLFLNAGFPRISATLKRHWCLILVLIYPVVMYPASRGDTAFILLLCLALVIALEARNQRAFVVLLTLLSLARADLALFAAIFAMIWDTSLLPRAMWAGLAAIPVSIQFAMKYVIFPDAEYYVDVVMLNENLKFNILLATPMFALVAGLIFINYRAVARFVSWQLSRTAREKLLMGSIGAYAIAVSVVAIVAETRLFLPLAPFMLLMVQDYLSRDNRPSRQTTP